MIHLGFVFASPGSTGKCENLYLGKKDITQVPAREGNGNDSPLSPTDLGTTKTVNIFSWYFVQYREIDTLHLVMFIYNISAAFHLHWVPTFSSLTVLQRPRISDLCEGAGRWFWSAFRDSSGTDVFSLVCLRPSSLHPEGISQPPLLGNKAQCFLVLVTVGSDPDCVTSSILSDYAELSVSSSVSGVTLTTHGFCAASQRSGIWRLPQSLAHGESANICCYGFFFGRIGK